MEKKIELKKITWQNYYRICKLKVNKEQRNFVAENKWSLIHAYVGISNGMPAYPFGIYLGRKAIGFCMCGFNGWEKGDPEFMKNNYFVWRFMIDKNYQGNGYGKEAFKQLLEFIKTFPNGKSELCWLSYEPENEVAKKMYASFGFVEAPEFYKEGEEMPAILKL